VEVVLGEFGNQLVALAPHIGGQFLHSFSSQRASFYGVTGTPTIHVDGSRRQFGTTGTCSGDAANFRTLINQRLAETGGQSPVSITGVYSFDATTVSVSATFELLDPVTLVSPTAYLVIYEDGISYGGNAYHHVVRNGHSQAVTLAQVGDMATVTQVFPRGNWNINNVGAVAFLQRGTGTWNQKEVYQTAKLPMVADFRFVYECLIGSAPHGNGTVEFAAVLTNISDETDELTVSLNNTFGWPAEFMLAGESGFHTTPSVVALGPDEEIGVTLRVSTDAELRTGSGAIVVTSTASSRTQFNPATVFNGSPAVLVVGDDSYKFEEEIITNALTAKGYLYAHWDCYYDHNNAGPAYDDMKCYDVVIWHHGYEISNLLSTAEIQAIMDFMDAGKGFILSSQDILSQTSPALPAAFRSDYLGLGGFTVNVDADYAQGFAGDPITDGMSFDLTYPYSHWDRADDLVPNAYSTVIFHSEDQDRIALRTDNGTARSVFFAYCLNAMSESAPAPNNPATLLDRAIQWVLPQPSQSVPEQVPAGLASAIRSVTPSPFAWDAWGASAIRMRISERAAGGPSRLDVVDLNGRLVRNLVDGPLPQGVASASWDGRDASGQPVSAGVYYLRLQTADGTHSARTAVLR